MLFVFGPPAGSHSGAVVIPGLALASEIGKRPRRRLLLLRGVVGIASFLKAVQHHLFLVARGPRANGTGKRRTGVGAEVAG